SWSMSRAQQLTARRGIPITVSVAFAVAVAGGPLLPRSGALPAVALGTTWILYGLRALAIFYGVLLLVIPLIRALRGELPVELSTRGARYEETTVNAALGTLAARVDEMEAALRELGAATAASDARLTILEEGPPGPENRRR